MDTQLNIPTTAVVTGGASGIGMATARLLAKAGITPAILDRDEIGAKQVAEQLNQEFDLDTIAIRVDVSDDLSVAEAVRFAAEHFETLGGIGYAVHCAGITDDGMTIRKNRETNSVEVMSIEQWQRVIDINLTGTFLVLREVARHMVDNGNPGSIVALSSVSANGNLGQPNYSAAKAGVRAFATELAIELGRYGIRVNSLAPGFTRTPMTERLPEKVVQRVERATMLNRFAESHEMAIAIYNLLVTETYVTGQDRVIDGGMTFGLKM